MSEPDVQRALTHIDDALVICGAGGLSGWELRQVLGFCLTQARIALDGVTVFDELEQVGRALDAMREGAALAPENAVGRPPVRRIAAGEWLTSYLADAGKPVPSGMILQDAKQHGMAPKTLRRAAGDIGVVKQPPGGGRNCTWELP
jgi:hypothetical protein